MRKLIVFNQVTLDGFFADAKGDLSWAHKSDPEWNEFVGANASGGGMLLFGRKTYQLMASYWPTPYAMHDNAQLAQGMNALPKVVFSKTLKKATWNNTRLVKRGLSAEVRKLKEGAGDELVVLGSGTIVSQLALEGLVDEFQLVVNPLVLGKGRPLFVGLKKPLALRLLDTRRFKNGNVLMRYAPS